MDDPRKFETVEDFINQTHTEPETEPDKDPAEPAVEPATGSDPVPPETDPAPADPEGDPEAGKETDKGKVTPPKPNPMKELRDRATAAQREQAKIDGAITRLSEGDYNFKLKDFRTEEGKMDYDALIAAMDDEDVKQRANTRGISPEMQAEIEKYEREKKEIELQKARVQMDRQLNNFQLEMKLSSEDLNLFISDSMKIGINPLAIAALDRTPKGTTALQLLHKAVYFDKLADEKVQQALAEAEEKRLKNEEAKGGQPKSNPADPNTTKTTKTDPKGLALEEFLDTL